MKCSLKSEVTTVLRSWHCVNLPWLRSGAHGAALKTLKEQIEELEIAWRASLDDKITADDFRLFLSGVVTLMVTDSVRTMLRTGMTTDEVNEYLADVLMPNTRRVQRDALGVFNAALNDLTAPTLSLN